jgi:hypothetical protein
MRTFEAMLQPDSRDRLEALKLWLSYCYGPPPEEEALPDGQARPHAREAVVVIKQGPNGETRHSLKGSQTKSWSR